MTVIIRNNIFIVLVILGGCRFSRPIIRFDHHSVQKKDTVDKTVSNVDSYRSIRLDWNRGPHLFGEFDVTRTYNEQGRLVAEAYTRRAIRGSMHNYQKETRKRVWHSTQGKIITVDRTIDKYRGLMRNRVYHKTWIWHSNLKLYVKIDQRSNKPVPEDLKRLLPY